MRRQKMYRFVSSVRLSALASSAIVSRSTSDRLIQLSSPRRTMTEASAKRNAPMKPHCMRKSPYANAEVATSRANIQKTIMAVLALYLCPVGRPSASCNGPGPLARMPWPGGREEHHDQPDQRDHVAGAVRLGEQPVGRAGDHDPVAHPAEAGADAYAPAPLPRPH